MCRGVALSCAAQSTIASTSIAMWPPSPRSAGARDRRGVLDAEDAIEIYRVKTQKTPRDSARLAAIYGITPKAVRDIWNHRTWSNATMVLWTREEAQAYLKDRLCSACFAAGVASLATACPKCLPRAIVRAEDGGSESSTRAQSPFSAKSPMDAKAPMEVEAPPGPPPLIKSGEHTPCAPWATDVLAAYHAQVAHLSPEESRKIAADAFPHTRVHENVQYDSQGWLMDPRMIGLFICGMA